MKPYLRLLAVRRRPLSSTASETPLPSEQVLARISEFELAAARAMACLASTAVRQAATACMLLRNWVGSL